MDTWCSAQGLVRGGLLSIQTAWALAQAWYHDRLEPSWRRKTLAEAQDLFAGLGMTNSFWDLGALDPPG